jgi:DNA-binding GntR family transcriptional regulator
MSESLNAQTYENLKRDIMTLELMPGEVLSAAKIADRYNVSRTPAREALVRLETEGLVEIYPQVGSVVSRIDEDRARQEWFVRRALEMGVVDGLFDNVSENDIGRMRDYCRMMEAASGEMNDPSKAYDYLRYDNEFHAVTYYVAGQKLAAELVANTMAHYNRIRFLIIMEKPFNDRTLESHDQLVRSIGTRDKETYRKLLHEHIWFFEKDIEEIKRGRPEMFKQSPGADKADKTA